MEQNTQPQSQQPISPTPQGGKKKIITVAFIIAVIVVGAGVYFWTMNNAGKDSGKQNTQIQNQSSQSSSSNSVSAEINPRDYSLVEYPLKDSPVYNQLFCFDKTEAGRKDARIVKNDNEVIIHSLLQLIPLTYGSQGGKLNKCIKTIMDFEIFSAPINGKYLYLRDRPSSSGEYGIYRLDLSSLSIEDLTTFPYRYESIEDLTTYPNYESIRIRNDEQPSVMYPSEIGNGITTGEYELLSDGKRMLKWSSSVVFLVNLETNSARVLYVTPQNQWLIAMLEGDKFSEHSTYDIKIEGNQVMVGVYDKTKNNDGEPTIIDEYGVIVNKHGEINYEGGVKLKLINRITIPIPAD